jgi:hypothetical protein
VKRHPSRRQITLAGGAGATAALRGTERRQPMQPAWGATTTLVNVRVMNADTSGSSQESVERGFPHRSVATFVHDRLWSDPACAGTAVRARPAATEIRAQCSESHVPGSPRVLIFSWSAGGLQSALCAHRCVARCRGTIGQMDEAAGRRAHRLCSCAIRNSPGRSPTACRTMTTSTQPMPLGDAAAILRAPLRSRLSPRPYRGQQPPRTQGRPRPREHAGRPMGYAPRGATPSRLHESVATEARGRRHGPGRSDRARSPIG